MRDLLLNKLDDPTQKNVRGMSNKGFHFVLCIKYGTIFSLAMRVFNSNVEIINNPLTFPHDLFSSD